MKTVHVLRKPCAESTVAANVLRYGTGALNIGESRIGNWQTRLDPACNKGANGRARFNTLGPVNTTGYTNSETKNGRWPANLVLQHLDGCVQDGVKKMPGHKGYPNGPGGSSMQYTSSRRGSEVRPSAWKGHADPDGTETVTAWACVEGCPVASLPFTVTNPGTLQSDASNGRHISIAPIRRHGTGLSSGNSGGASRFFKQVKP